MEDSVMKHELEKFRHFELLNTERITPEFLKLAKSLNTDYSLKDIRGADGMRFASESLQEKFIVDYFADIYKSVISIGVRGSLKIFWAPKSYRIH
jgi:hypothetical protein